MEVVKGLHKVRREERLQSFLSKIVSTRVLPLDVRSAELAGRIHADLERVGSPLGFADPAIAATALTHELVLVTGNQEHYERIRELGYDLPLDNWRQAAPLG